MGMRGLSGDAEDFKDCTIQLGVIVSDTKQLVSDIKGRNFSAVFDDLKAIYAALADLTPGLELTDGPIDPLCKYDDPTAGERQIWVEGCQGAGCKANTMDDDCAWCVYDVELCRSRYPGTVCDEIVAAREAQGVTSCDSAPTPPTPTPDVPTPTPVPTPDVPTPTPTVPTPTPTAPTPIPTPDVPPPT